VVIAVIGILAALLLPALARSQQSARRIVCLNHLKQLSLSAVIYVADNDHYYPSSNSPDKWPQALRPGYQQLGLLACPEDRSIVSPPQEAASADLAPRSYLINAWTDYFDLLPQPVEFEVMPDSFIRQPSDTVVFGEKEEAQGDFLMDLRTANQETVLEQTRHTGGANYALADGSARFLRFGQSLRPVNLWAVTPEARQNLTP